MAEAISPMAASATKARMGTIGIRWVLLRWLAGRVPEAFLAGDLEEASARAWDLGELLPLRERAGSLPRERDRDASLLPRTCERGSVLVRP